MPCAGTMPLTDGSLGGHLPSHNNRRDIQGVDYRMFKGLEVGKEHKGRPVKKLESDDEGFS